MSEVIQNSNESSSHTTPSDSSEYEIQSYSRRWFILVISCTAVFLRGFNQACYGPVNSVFSKYLNVQPWQVDWFILSQSVVFLSMSLPMSWATSKFGLRKCYIVLTSLLMLGFALTTIGCSTRKGYIAIIFGQTLMGFSNILSWSIPPPTAALWFPVNEVATAVALQVVGKGAGEAVGSILTPAIVKSSMRNQKIGFRLTILFITLTVISLLLTIAAVIVLKDEPPLPPSIAQAKAKQIRQKDEINRDRSLIGTLKEYRQTMKELFTNVNFVAVWFAFGAVYPVMRNNSVLLSSILTETFSQYNTMNEKAGFVLMGGWITYTVGGFIAGPIITKTKKYKQMVFYSILLECLSCAVILIGVRHRILYSVYAGIVLLGLFLGVANTALFELLVEVTYPKPTMLVTMVNISGFGFFRLVYPIIGRLMLKYLGPVASTAFPVGMTALATIAVGVIRPTYHRLNSYAPTPTEETPLIEE
ncbi:choline/ethanolamine transporter FLVCR2-like [Ciona intestinalis]